MKKVYIILILSLWRIVAVSQGLNGPVTMPQTNLVVIPPTPDASSLFKFVETPVGKYTGIPDISVPVYDIKLRGLSLPISFNYHSGGYRVDEQSSDVGLGWALEAGGQISSTVFGKSDLDGSGYKSLGTTGIFSFPYNRPLLPTATTGPALNPNADYTTLMNIEGLPFIDSHQPPLATGGPLDTQPDVFYYSMFGQSGKFFYTVDGQTHPVPFNKMKITGTVIGGYQIIDEKGNTYIFDQNEQINTTSIPTASESAFVGSINNTVNFTFYLTHIYTLQGDTVNLTYNTLPYYNYHNISSYTRYHAFPGQTCSADAQSSNGSLTEIYHSKQLSDITTNRGHKIHFTYASCHRLDMPGRQALQQIDVYFNNQVKSFALTQEYLNLSSYNCSTVVDSNTVKLKLKQVAVTGSGNYNFNYYNEYDTFPARFDFATDHWGYYNGSSGGSPFPVDATNGFTTGNDKSPNLTYCVKGILQKIQYPTGGYTTYDYESNQYAFSGANVNGGGLRVKTIKNFSNDGSGIPVHTRNFTYLEAGTTASSGHIYNVPSYYYQYTKNNYSIWSGDSSVLVTTTCLYHTQTSQSNLPLSGMQYGNVVYDEVQEYEADNSGNNNGYSDNYYSFTPNLTPYSGYPFTPPTNFDWKNGTLLKSEIYKNNGTGYTLQKRVTDTYEDNYTPPNPNIPGSNGEDADVYTTPVQPNETHAVGLNVLVIQPQYLLHGSTLLSQVYYPAVFQVEAYNVISAWQTLTSSYEEDFENGITNPLTKTINYSYDNPVHTQLTKTQETNSDGKKYFSLTTYPNDYAAGTSFIDDLITANNIATPIEKVSYQQLADNSINILNGSITEYLPGGRAQVNNVYGLETNKPIPLSAYKFSNAVTGSLPNYSGLAGYAKDAHYQLRASITNYDTNFNPKAVTIANGTTTGYKWAYPDQNPVAVCKNASDLEFYAENFENSTVLNVISGTAHTGNKYYHGAYTVSWTRPNGRNYVITYWYKTGTGAWQFKRDSYASYQYILTGGDSYDDICVYPADAKLTTYTYDPLIGMTSTIDPSGKTTHYEYDTNQRLNNIRDQDGNIIKSFCYNYAGQAIGCNIPQTPPPSQTIYARMEVTNYVSHSDNSDPDNLYTTVYGDVYFRFYQDAACTVPLTLNYNVDVIASETQATFNGSGINPPPSTTNTTYSIQSGVTQAYLGNFLVTESDTFFDPGFSTITNTNNWSFTLLANGTQYIAKPTLN